MKARIERRRIGFRMIFLLIVQTVCLAALPTGTVAVQQISGTVICTEFPEQASCIKQQDMRSGIRRMQKKDIPVIAASAVLLTACAVCALPPRRTPVRNQVRMDN